MTCFFSFSFISVHIISPKFSIWFSIVRHIDVLALLSEIHRKSKARVHFKFTSMNELTLF